MLPGQTSPVLPHAWTLVLLSVLPCLPCPSPGAVLSARLSSPQEPSCIHCAPPHGATHLSSSRDNSVFMATTRSLVIWFWEWKKTLNTLLHGSCKGRNKIPKEELGEEHLAELGWGLHSRGIPGAPWFALTRYSWSTMVCSNPISFRETILVPCTGWRSMFMQVPRHYLQLSKARQPGLGSAEEVEVLSKAGASCVSSVQNLLSSLGA